MPKHVYPVGAAVQYLSASQNAWLPATITGHAANGSYDLNVKPGVGVDKIKIVTFAAGSAVEYLSTSQQKWVTAKVVSFNKDHLTYDLDLKQGLTLDKVRLPQSAKTSSTTEPVAGNFAPPERPAERAKSPMPAASHPAAAAPAAGSWEEQTLTLHNKMRAKHGCPPLQWSNECYGSAQKQVDICQAKKALSHGSMEGPSGKHGQNVFFANPGKGVEGAVTQWYDEIKKHNFKSDFQPGTGHFSQVVWCASEFVGMAKSADGTYIVANYFPGGNMTGQYGDNVPPPGSAPRARPHKKAHHDHGHANTGHHHHGGQHHGGSPSAVPGSAHQKAAAPGSKTPNYAEWEENTLTAHNRLRAKHGAPPLKWNKECLALAQQQANKCQESANLGHGSVDGPSGRHGQNVFMATAPKDPEAALDAWYGEIKVHDFNKDFQGGSGHFSQVVWVNSEFVGMARSPNGLYIVANYIPGGNMMGGYKTNVLPAGSAMHQRKPVEKQSGAQLLPAGVGKDAGRAKSPAPSSSQQAASGGQPKVIMTGTVKANSMSKDLVAVFEGVPNDRYKQMAVDCFKKGGTVEVVREKASIKVSCTVSGSTNSASASW